MNTDQLNSHIEWLLRHHRQTSGAARNLRVSIAHTEDALIAEQKRKAADAAALNAEHFHEIAEALAAIRSARQVLASLESDGVQNLKQRLRFVEQVDRALSFVTSAHVAATH